MPNTAQAQAAMMSLSQFKTTAIKTHSRVSVSMSFLSQSEDDTLDFFQQEKGNLGMMFVYKIVTNSILSASKINWFLFLQQTIEFELRKLDAQQAAEQINLLKSFMPNSFLISGGL